MPRIVITHSVSDVDKWLAYKGERAEAIGSMGGTNVTDHVARDGSKMVAVTLDAADFAAVEAVLSTPPPELLAAMEKHGVIPPISVFIEK
jgi:hypothetical protein